MLPGLGGFGARGSGRSGWVRVPTVGGKAIARPGLDKSGWLSGVNGLLVGDWLNSKYGMQNAKDPQRLDTYYNKRHGAEKITQILNLINSELLDGEALKSQNK